MQTLTLKPKTLRAKSKIREAAARTLNWDMRTWDVLQTRMKLAYGIKEGPWHLVAPSVTLMGKEKCGELSRWVHSSDDQDFMVELTGCKN